MTGGGGRLEQGWALHGLGRFDDAKTAARAALAEDPERARAWLLLAYCELDLGDAKAAFDAATRGLTVDPDHADLHLTASGAATGTDKIDLALEHAASAIRLAPNAPGPRLTAAHAHLKRGKSRDLREAELHIDRAQQLAPNWADVPFYRARLQAKRNQPEGAKQSLRQVLEMEPNHRLASVFLADLDRRTGDAGKASDLIQAALALNPDDAYARGRLDGLIRDAVINLAWLSLAVGIVISIALGFLLAGG